MLKNENQLTYRESQMFIEENYTNLDIESRDNYNMVFKYPQRWIESPSQNKVVGIRRLNIIPTPHVYKLTFHVVKPSSVTGTGPRDRYITFNITQDNNLHEVLTHICNDLSNGFGNYKFDYVYDNSGKLTLKCTYESDATAATPVNFSIYSENDKDIEEFLKFLNQEVNDTNKSILTTNSNNKTFNNVWDREYLEFHASFSDSKRGFIGINKDFYYKPSIIYPSPTNEFTFSIRFTTDGKNNINILYSRFIIQLTFIYNYRKRLLA